ncbi:hypothetical protein BDN67DRAFT_980515 [Paxillus ammoniavirescens]|nr:hypothetical protein BDN67DRAFT_980515 [Paxillus ammoniavirescens]
MPAKIFSDEQTTILESVLAEYQGLSGKDKVQDKEAIIAQVIEQVAKVQHQNNIQAMKKLHKGKWLEAQDFMIGLSNDKAYRQLVMALERLPDNGGPNDHLGLHISVPTDFSWDREEHHSGKKPHSSWHETLTSLAFFQQPNLLAEHFRHWHIALHVLFIGMVLRDMTMSSPIQPPAPTPLFLCLWLLLKSPNMTLPKQFNGVTA